MSTVYHNPSDRFDQLQKLRESSVRRGDYIGYEALKEGLTLKKGYPLYIAGNPASGKTQFIRQVCVNAARIHKYRIFLYLGEDGSVDDVIGDLAEVYIGKPFRKLRDDGTPNSYAMTDEEFRDAVYFISEYFVICDPEEAEADDFGYYLDDFYNAVEQAEMESAKKFDMVVLDPFNDIEMELEEANGREDIWLKGLLKKTREASKHNNRIDVLVHHTAKTSATLKSAGGQRYAPPPTPTEWAGGVTWQRRAFTMVLIYRPHVGQEFDGVVCVAQEETWVIVQKAKPKGASECGVYRLFYDWKTSNYYEMDVKPNENPHGLTKYYCGDKHRILSQGHQPLRAVPF